MNEFGVGTVGVSEFHNGDEKNLKFVGDNMLFGRSGPSAVSSDQAKTVTLYYGLSYRY